MSARRISFLNFKGGVGKTTLAVNVAASLAHDLQRKVLLVDCDPQSNASIWLMGLRWSQIGVEHSLASIFQPNFSVLRSIQKSVVRSQDGTPLIRNLDLLPAKNEMLGIEDEPKREPSHYFQFYEKLSGCFDSYDYIIFDCPPHPFRLTRCALFATKEIYVPCNPDELSRQGLTLLNKTVDEFKTETAHERLIIEKYFPPQVRGIIINNIQKGSKYDSLDDLEEKAKRLKRESNNFDPHAFSIQISSSILAQRSVHTHKPLAAETKKSPLQEQYNNLAKLIESKGDPDGSD